MKLIIMLGFMKICAHLQIGSVLVVYSKTAGALRWLLTFCLNAIRWRKWLGTHGGNVSARHGRKCTAIICPVIFLSDEILYIVNDDDLSPFVSAGIAVCSRSAGDSVSVNALMPCSW